MTVAPLALAVPAVVVVVAIVVVAIGPLPAIDLEQLPPGEMTIVAQRRVAVPVTETAVMPEPAGHVSVAVHAHVMLARRVVIVGALVGYGRRCRREAEAEDDG